jgi:hypothetical protein
MPSRWIRLDVGWEDSAWLDALDGTASGCWPRLLCWVKRDGIRGRVKRPHPGVAARRWRVPESAVAALEDAAISSEALAIEDGQWIVLKWKEFQEPDATTNERSKRYRQSKHRLSPSRRDTVTDRDSRRDPSMSMSIEDTGVKKETRKGKILLPTDWQPSEKLCAMAIGLRVDADVEAAKMRDWATSEGKRKVDWDAAFRNWLRNARPTGNGAGADSSLADVKKLIKAGGSMLFNAFGREHGFQTIAEKHPAEWAKYEEVLRKIEYSDLKTLVENKNLIEYTKALESQLKAIQNAA